MSSFEGKQVYPKSISKEEVFDTATDEIEVNKNSVKENKKLIPDGKYFLNENYKNFGIVKATMSVTNGKFIVEKGSMCLPCEKDWMPEARKNAKIKNGILQEDVECNSPSTAGWVVLGNANNGWTTWKNKDGKPINIYRK